MSMFMVLGILGRLLHHRSVQEDRTDHTNLLHRSFTGSGLTKHLKSRFSWFLELLGDSFITEVSRRTTRTIRIYRSFTGSGLTKHQKSQFSWCLELLEGYFITEVSRRTAQTIRIYSVEVSPDLVLLNIRKVEFHVFWVYWKVTSSQKCPGGPHGPYESVPSKFHRIWSY